MVLLKEIVISFGKQHTFVLIDYRFLTFDLGIRFMHSVCKEKVDMDPGR